MKVAGWAGIVFVVLSGAIIVMVPFWPPLGASADVIVAYHRAHRLPFLIGNYLAVAAAIPSFAQIGAVVLLFKRAEGEGGWLWIAMLASVVLAHAMGALALIAYQVVPFELAPGQEAVAKGFSDLAGVAFAAFLLAVAAYVVFTCWATWSTGALPRWYAQFGAAVGALCVVGSLGAIFSEPVWLAGGGLLSCAALGAFCTWCLVLSLLFLKMPAPPQIG